MLRMLLRFPKGIFDGAHHCSPQASGERITGTPPLLLRMPDPGLHHGASCPCAPAFRVSPVSAQNKKACARQAFDIRTATPATTTQRRGPACRPEKSFFGVGWGPGGRKGQFLQKTPLPSPSRHPGKNHASTGRRASMAALSRTRWLELPRKSSSRSRRAST